MRPPRPLLALAVFLIAAFCVWSAPGVALAAPSSFDPIAPGLLLWGGDQEGGGPYVYPADDDPSRVVGFEVELAEKLARELGLRASFFQGQWDKMPELLRTRKCDILLNGYEWTPARLE